MKREWFRRGVRMTHRLDDLEGRGDPLNSGSFDPKFPVRPDQRRSGPLNVQQHGERNYGASSPVCKPTGGYASINGPKPDYAQDVAMPVPVSTRKRKQP